MAGEAQTPVEVTEHEQAMIDKVREHPNINYIENFFAIDLITNDEQRCLGLIGHHERFGREIIWAPSTILATGGAGILISDALVMEGLEVAEITERTKERLAEVLPPISTPRNPVDVIGDAGFYLYESASKILLEDENVDGIVVVCVHAGYARPKEYVGALEKLVREHTGYGKPILGCWIGGEEMASVILDLKEENIPVYPSTTRAARAMAALYHEELRLNKRGNKAD